MVMELETNAPQRLPINQDVGWLPEKKQKKKKKPTLIVKHVDVEDMFSLSNKQINIVSRIFWRAPMNFLPYKK